MRVVRHQFTLLEMFITAVVVVIFIILFVSIVRGPGRQSERTTCLNNLKQNSMACFTYADDFDKHLPCADSRIGLNSYSRNGRSWSLQLTLNGYLDRHWIKTQVTSKNDVVTNARYTVPNPLYCPTFPVVEHMEEGIKLDNGACSALTTYGMRQGEPHSNVQFRFDEWDFSDSSSGSLRLPDVNTTVPYLADSHINRLDTPAPRQYFALLSKEFYGRPGAFIYRLHDDRANCAFLDGSVQAMSESALNTVGDRKAFYSIPNQLED